MSSSQVAGVLTRVVRSPNSKVKPCNCDCNNSIPIIQDNETSHENRLANTYFRIPKFFQAIVTLIICVIILGTTLCIIVHFRKRFCKRKSNHLLLDTEAQSESGFLNQSSPEAVASNSNNQNHQSVSPLGRTPTVRFARQPSGPFSDAAIDFARETYKKKKPAKTKEEVIPEGVDEQKRADAT